MFKTNFKGVTLPTKVHLGKDGFDVEIENFNVTHEILGHKEWELKADIAQINTATKVTQLKQVELILHQKNNEKAFLYADKGTLYEATREVDLQGHVKLISTADVLRGHYN